MNPGIPLANSTILRMEMVDSSANFFHSATSVDPGGFITGGFITGGATGGAGAAAAPAACGLSCLEAK